MSEQGIVNPYTRIPDSNEFDPNIIDQTQQSTIVENQIVVVKKPGNMWSRWFASMSLKLKNFSVVKIKNNEGRKVVPKRMAKQKTQRMTDQNGKRANMVRLPSYMYSDGSLPQGVLPDRQSNILMSQGNFERDDSLSRLNVEIPQSVRSMVII